MIPNPTMAITLSKPVAPMATVVTPLSIPKPSSLNRSIDGMITAGETADSINLDKIKVVFI